MAGGKRKRRKIPPRLSVPERARRILNLIAIIFFLIAVRLWHLTVVQHEERLEESRRPQRRVAIEPAQRGTIRDRFNLPLAINRVQYNAAVLYSEIREIPATRWERNEKGERVRRTPRRDYIRALSEKLADELNLDADRVEDLIHSRAALFPNLPYVLAENIDEECYCRLRGLEYAWPGICGQRLPRRCYPRGKVAGDLLGYMGSISQEEYAAIAGEIEQLRSYLAACDEGRFPPFPEGLSSTKEVCERLTALQDRAYSIHDQVGKSGVELRYDEELRGYRGRRLYLTDIYGNYLRPLPGGQEPLPGKRIILSISAELQEFAEELLTQNEQIRDGRSYYFDREKRERRVSRPLKQPWIKGGAIVAIDPNTGELLALASYPRFDPNDFVSRKEVDRWLETDRFVGEVWDGRRTLRRERYHPLAHEIQEEEVKLDWSHYLELILPSTNGARQAIERLETVEGAVELQQTFEELLHLAQGWQPREVVDALYCRDGDIPFSNSLAYVEARGWLCDPRVVQLQRKLDLSLSLLARNYDKLLLIDLCRLAVDSSSFSPELLEAVGSMGLADYRTATAAALSLEEVVCKIAKELFSDHDFRRWREEQGKLFLKERRRIEKEEGRYAKPYLDHFDQQEREMFDLFWAAHRRTLLLAFLGLPVGREEGLQPYLDELCLWSRELHQGAHRSLPWACHYERLTAALEPLGPSLAKQFLEGVRSFGDLQEPLLGRYRYLRGSKLCHLAAAFYPRYGYGFCRSYAFRQAAPFGSIFKIVTAYEALTQHYAKTSNLNPLTIIDDVHRCKDGKPGWNVGFFMDGRPIPMSYRGGRLIPTLRRNVGEIGIVEAIACSSNSYFGLLVREVMESPADLGRAALALSFGRRTGVDLPGEYAGKVPDDLESNPSGAYAFSIGQHSLVVTPLQAAVALSAIANGGKIFRPKVASLIAGSDPTREGELLFAHRNFPFQRSLELVGVNFPLFTAADRTVHEPEVTSIPPRLVDELPLDPSIRNLLLSSLRAVVMAEKGVRSYHDYPWMVRDYIDLKEQIVGKTSTAEIVENVDLDADWGTNTYNHIWFAGISFEPGEVHKGEFGKPELVVVVFLRYGDFGRETAPLAAQMVKRWREIRQARASMGPSLGSGGGS